ncbi:MAG TPA: DUF5118 domain-containing protein, partial [Gemmatimonadales bacterium]|nr:DUF5118 domain-containing protein [Gemmatimonadales bacterium]
MRPIIALLAFGVLACSSAGSASSNQQPAPAPGPTHQDTSRAGGGRQAPADGVAPKPYNQVITSQAVTDSGVFIIHRISDKLYYEIPRRMLGREFILVVDRRGTIRGVGYAGEQIAARAVRWDRFGNHILLRLI